MTVSYLPVIPPEIRPIIKLTDNTLVISNLNFLYNKLINNNNRAKKLNKMNINKTFLNKEKIIIQETMDNILLKCKKYFIILINKLKKNN